MRQKINQNLYCLSDLTELVYFKPPSKKSGAYNMNDPRITYTEVITTRVARIKKSPFALKHGTNNNTTAEVTDIFIATFDNVKAKIDIDWTIEWNNNHYKIISTQFIEEAGRTIWIEFNTRLKGDKAIPNNY